MENSDQNIILLLQRVSVDSRLNSTAITMYLSLLLLWKQNDYCNPFKITRRQVMVSSKIKSIASYHRIINDLIQFNYILYKASFDSRAGSHVSILTENPISTDNKLISINALFKIPTFFEVKLFFEDYNHFENQAMAFFSFYNDRNWQRSRQKPMKCWKAAARKWISHSKKSFNF